MQRRSSNKYAAFPNVYTAVRVPVSRSTKQYTATGVPSPHLTPAVRPILDPARRSVPIILTAAAAVVLCYAVGFGVSWGGRKPETRVPLHRVAFCFTHCFLHCPQQCCSTWVRPPASTSRVQHKRAGDRVTGLSCVLASVHAIESIVCEHEYVEVCISAV